MKNHPQDLENIWYQVPPDYYQNGVSKNILQQIWHTGKLNVVSNMIPPNSASILDVGCASGWFLSQIHGKYPAARCVGVDSYDKAIEYGKKEYKHLELHCVDAHKLPFKKNSFDVVVCTEVLEHVIDPVEVLKEIKRVLKPNGIGVIEMDTGNILFKIAWYWWTNLRNGVWKDSHIHAFNTKKLETMMVNTGFKIVEKKVFNYTMAVAFKVKIVSSS